MNTHTGILTLTTTAGLLIFAAMLPGAHAYGNTAQWQIGFSGNCNLPSACGPPGGTGTSGFWGWCAFGGSTASGTSGTIGDCQVTQYARSNLGQPNNPTHLAIDITGWTIASSGISPTGSSFQITRNAFTLECTGPGASLPSTPFSGCSIPPGGTQASHQLQVTTRSAHSLASKSTFKSTSYLETIPV
ncbi:MAG TPA: hypothetical protein VNA15_04290 [Candidatus Angelobacter sp.]|nr:hypothetical protein [Candidatus Angelobacter sp.]